MNAKLTVAAVLWVSGFIAALILVGRWQRMGGTNVEMSMPEPEPVPEHVPTASVSKVQRTAERVAGPVLAGAKADLLTAFNATNKVSRRVTSTIVKPNAAIGS